MSNTINHLDLFSGLGGFSLGLEIACKNKNIQYNHPTFVEIKPSAIKALSGNFNIQKSKLPLPCSIEDCLTSINFNNDYQYNFLTAGFPCQPFSVAGNKEGFNDKHGRGNMFFYIVDILKSKKPKYFILENVPNLIHHDKGRTFNIIQQHLKDLGYIFDYYIFDSAKFGLVQHRKRVFIYGVLKESLSAAACVKLAAEQGEAARSYVKQDAKPKQSGALPLALLLSNEDRNVGDFELYQKIQQIKNNYELNASNIQPKYFDSIMQKSTQTVKYEKETTNQFVQKILHYSNEYRIDLGNKSINDKRGGSSNIHSWHIGLFGETDKNQLDNELLDFILLECRKKSNDAFKTGKLDGIPLTVDILYSNIQFKHPELAKIYTSEQLLLNSLNRLTNIGYLNEYLYVISDGRINSANKKVKIVLKKNAKDNDRILATAYSVITNKLRFPFYTFLTATSKSIMKTLTATDAYQVGVAELEMERSVRDGKNKSDTISKVKSIRHLYKREMLDSLGFPDHYHLDMFKEYDKAVYDLCGNSLAVPIVTFIAEQLLDMFE